MARKKKKLGHALLKRRGASDMITKRMRTKYIIGAVKTHVTLSSFVALMEPLGIYLVIVRTKVKLQYISLLSRSMNRANVDMDNVDVDSTSNASDDIFAVTASTDKLCEGPVSRFDARKVLLQQWILSKKRKLQANSWLKFFFRCCSILVLMTLIVVTVAVVTRLWSSRTFGDCSSFQGTVHYLFWPHIKNFVLCHHKSPKLRAKLGLHHNYINTVKYKDNLFAYSSETELNITKVSSNCLRVEWSGYSSVTSPLLDCFQLGNASWYGGYETYNQLWPINGANKSMTPFLPRDYKKDPQQPDLNAFGPVLHPLWISSSGIGLVVDKETSLHVSINSSQICIQALPFITKEHVQELLFLKYTICVFENAAVLARHLLRDSQMFEHPSSTPNEQLFRNPLWYRNTENKSTPAEFLKHIHDSNLNISQIVLGQNYLESAHREFDENGIPNLLEVNYTEIAPVSVSINHFVSMKNTVLFNQCLDNGLFLLADNEEVVLVKKHEDYGSFLNIANDTVSEFFSRWLVAFMDKHQFKSVWFDGIEVDYLPWHYNITDFTRAYMEFAGNQDYTTLIHGGYFSQSQASFITTLDRTPTSWDVDNGLKSILTTALSLGIAGYPFFTVGSLGEAPNSKNVVCYGGISSEFYVRWLQLIAFFPAVQFSVPPWDECLHSDKNISMVAVALDMMSVRQDIIQDILDLATEAVDTGYPIIRPLWWNIEVESEEIWKINDEFLIGNDILVAPVLDEGIVNHRIYFPGPDTEWVAMRPNAIKGQVFEGGSTYTVQVTLEDTVYFRKRQHV